MGGVARPGLSKPDGSPSMSWFFSVGDNDDLGWLCLCPPQMLFSERGSLVSGMRRPNWTTVNPTR